MAHIFYGEILKNFDGLLSNTLLILSTGIISLIGHAAKITMQNGTKFYTKLLTKLALLFVRPIYLYHIYMHCCICGQLNLQIQMLISAKSEVTGLLIIILMPGHCNTAGET